MPTLYLLLGCTAVGKTEMALQWAERQDAEILSCDSLLFYRGMDIGTAKPSREEQSRVPHHLIDTNPIAEQMDVARYCELAWKTAESIHQRGRRVLVTGGSGFYLKSFFAPVVDQVEVSQALREQVRSLSPVETLRQLQALNPSGLGKLDTANPRRVSRALERCLASGRTLQELAEAFARQASPFSDWTLRTVRLEREPAELEERITLRVGKMLEGGLVDEVRRLLPLGLASNPSAARAIGYREVLDCLAGRCPWEGLAAAIELNTRHLVKKQRTWFRTQIPAHPVLQFRASAPLVVEDLFDSPDLSRG